MQWHTVFTEKKNGENGYLNKKENDNPFSKMAENTLPCGYTFLLIEKKCIKETI